MSRRDSLTAERLRDLLDYEPETGRFIRKTSKGGRAAGAEAGGISGEGYWQIMVDGVNHNAHRLAWLHFHGSWPIGQIDHINRCRTDNRLDNLREATNSENGHNRSMSSKNKSGIKGVHFYKRTGKWMVCCKVNGKTHHGGYHSRLEAAEEAAIKLRESLHGEFSCDGKDSNELRALLGKS